MRRNYGVMGVKGRSRSAGPASRAARARLGNATRRFMAQTRARSTTRVSRVSRNAKQGELKGVDTQLTLNPVISTTTTNASSFTLNLIQAGTGSWNRVGRKVYLQSVRVRLSFVHAYITTAVTGASVGNQLRAVLVWDKQPSGAAVPTYDTIFGRTDQAGTEATTVFDPIRYDNMDRFSIVREEIFSPLVTTSNLGTAAQTQNAYQSDWYVPLAGRECVFSGQSAPMTIADISTGALYLFFRSQFNAADDFITMLDDSFARLRYTD